MTGWVSDQKGVRRSEEAGDEQSPEFLEGKTLRYKGRRFPEKEQNFAKSAKLCATQLGANASAKENDEENGRDGRED